MGGASTILVRWAGGWLDVTDPDATGRRREAFLNLGHIDDPNEAIAVARDTLAILAGQRELIEVAIKAQTDATTPFVGWRPDPQTYITVPDWNGSPTAQKVASVTVTQSDPTGELTDAMELIDRRSEAEERINRAIKRMANGSVGGQSNQASFERPKWNPEVPHRVPAAEFGFADATEAVSVLTFSALYAQVRGELREWFCTLTAAGSTRTVADLLVNGAFVARCVIPAGALSATVPIAGQPLTPRRDWLQADIVEAGTGAAGWVGHAFADSIAS